MANLLMEEMTAGKLRLNGFGEYEVPAEIKNAILSNPDFFRAGAVGPDFYPDMIVGQTIIHPTNSGEWLSYMYQEVLGISTSDSRREQIIAFFMGFMMHYAGDLYGHDYVNKWARGWFPAIAEALKDTNKMKIIVRHILVESYIDERVPQNENLNLKAPIDFIKECFASEKAIARYPQDDKTNFLNYMATLGINVHNTALTNKVGMLDIFNYYNSWDKDVQTGIWQWLSTWNDIAQALLEENGLAKSKELIKMWFSSYFIKMTFVPDFIMKVIKGIAEIIDYLNILEPLKQLLLEQVKEIVCAMVYAATGVRVEDVEAALKQVADMFKNPKLYLNNGILYDERNITDQIDRELGNYGKSRNTLDQSFKAFCNCLNMGKLCLMGPNELNRLAREGGRTESAPFTSYKSIPSIRKIIITIKTSKDMWSGTDDNVYFGIITKDGKTYEILMDKPGYNDFERGDVDDYIFELPKQIRLDEIKQFRLRKDYIKISDDWKPEWIKVTDTDTRRILFDKTINQVIKDRNPYYMDVNLVGKIPQVAVEIDPSIISFMYSLDAKGLGMENPTLDKQWAHDGFVFFGDPNLRKNVMTKIFALDTSEYDHIIYNDYTLAKTHNRITKLIVWSGYIVDSVQVVYDTNNISQRHGSYSGRSGEVVLADGEYITEISGSIGKYNYGDDHQTIGQLGIKTSTGRIYTFGAGNEFVKERNFSFKPSKRFALMGKYYGGLDGNHYLSELNIVDL